MKNWKLYIVIGSILLAAVLASLAFCQGIKPPGPVPPEPQCAKAVVIDVSAPNMVTPRWFVVYDFEHQTASLMRVDTSDNPGLRVVKVVSYREQTKD